MDRRFVASGCWVQIVAGLPIYPLATGKEHSKRLVVGRALMKRRWRVPPAFLATGREGLNPGCGVERQINNGGQTSSSCVGTHNQARRIISPGNSVAHQLVILHAVDSAFRYRYALYACDDVPNQLFPLLWDHTIHRL